MHELEPVTDKFLIEAPLIITASVMLPDHSPEQVWEALGSERMWSWFPVIDQLRWVTPEPREAGCVRELRIGRAVTVREEFYRWDVNKRATFRVTHQSRKLLKGLAEDFLLDPQPGGGTYLTWTMCVAPIGPKPPRALAGLAGPGNKRAIAGIRKILP
ncbi:MAG: SRPBCC family protein [Baekduia sp.]